MPFIVFQISLNVVFICVWQNALFLLILAQIFDHLEHVIYVMLKCQKPLSQYLDPQY